MQAARKIAPDSQRFADDARIVIPPDSCGLKPAAGIMLGLLLALPLWGCIGLLAWRVLK